MRWRTAGRRAGHCRRAGARFSVTTRRSGNTKDRPRIPQLRPLPTVIAITADGGAWLKPSVLSTTAPKTITISIVQTALPGGGQLAGTFLGQLLLVSDLGITATVNVTVNVGDSTFTEQSPLNFVMPFGGANPLPQIVTVAASDNSAIPRGRYLQF